MMSQKTYAIWNNKGGVGKSYLTFQISAEYAKQNPHKQVVVIDMCPQANSSVMLLGGVTNGHNNLKKLHFFTQTPTSSPYTKSIAGYIQERIISPYVNPYKGQMYITDVHQYNPNIPANLSLVAGDQRLELQTPQIDGATRPGPNDAWRYVHLWISDLIVDIRQYYPDREVTVFIDCNPSFAIYTTIGLAASTNLLIPFTADGSSLLAVQSLINLVYGHNMQGFSQSSFHQNSMNYRMALPKIYMYMGNRLTQMNSSSATGFKNIVLEITDEIYRLWQSNPSVFEIHPNGATAPTNQSSFKKMFLYEINDANTASVYSSVEGIPLTVLRPGENTMNGKRVFINQTQLDKQQPNIENLVRNLM